MINVLGAISTTNTNCSACVFLGQYLDNQDICDLYYCDVNGGSYHYLTIVPTHENKSRHELSTLTIIAGESVEISVARCIYMGEDFSWAHTAYARSKIKNLIPDSEIQ